MRKRIYFVQPLGYYFPDEFWTRTTGLLVQALQEEGVDARLVVLRPHDGRTISDPRPVVVCTLQEMEDPAWWQAQQPDAAVLYMWGAPRYDRVRRAALQATPRVIERLDTSGIRIPRIWPLYYFLITWGLLRDDSRQNKVVGFLSALLRSIALLLFPSLMEKPMALSLALLPAVVAESPLAAARTERHIRWHSNAPVRVCQISNPVDSRQFFYRAGESKQDRLIAVGRWSSHQKDFPLLLASAAQFLQSHPSWGFDIIGGGVDASLVEALPPAIRERVVVHGKLPLETIGELNRRAKIHLLVSRWESFCVATLEALCCGCSYVGPGLLAGSSYLIENRSGTIAPRRTKEDLADALTAEAAAWETGRRDPAFIARMWTAESGHREVTARVMALLESIPERQAG